MSNSENQPKHGLENVSMWLYNNLDGYHITITTNYNTPTYKKRHFSLKSAACYNSWRRYESNQPPEYRTYFSNIRNKLEDNIIELNVNFRASKLAENTGTIGKRVCPGAIIVFDTDPKMFILYLGPKRFTGEFLTDHITQKQVDTGCVGSWSWKDEVIELGDAW